ncbi:MAG TPA: cyclic nucleotide-binding domain-containing protein [Burkholderiales bacterium]|jgi:CRP-like cAMP-binding protein|nr:cyclic nucleotide-binding domain-containing protein [Burkholderiales bacterium]
MEDLDFSAAPKKAIYDPAVARAFFKMAGSEETVPHGKSFFVENEKPGGLFAKSAKMYFLVDGEVSLTAGNKVIGTVGAGQIFGEMASIAQSPRTATAVAKTDCRAISLDEKQFQRAIQKIPEFALMLMSILIDRLRDVGARVTGSGLTDETTLSKRSVFEKKILEDLRLEFEGRAPVHAAKGKVFMTQGEAAAFMYVVLDGRVAISFKDRVVERVGTGGVVGEMALIDQSPRVATATAETDCTLLSINRKDFLLFIKTKPDFSMSLLKSLAERLRHMNTQLK